MIQFCEVETEHGCICYQLERKNVRNINLRIRTDASVYISAPKDVPESVVTQFVKRRSRYIAEAQQHFREFQQYAPQPRHYISGESFSVLGLQSASAGRARKKRRYTFRWRLSLSYRKRHRRSGTKKASC